MLNRDDHYMINKLINSAQDRYECVQSGLPARIQDVANKQLNDARTALEVRMDNLSKLSMAKIGARVEVEEDPEDAILTENGWEWEESGEKVTKPIGAYSFTVVWLGDD